MSFAHPFWLLALLAIPAVAWLRGRRGKPTALLYSSAELVRDLSGFHKSRAGQFLLALRWLALALLIVALARPQLTRSETKVTASGVDIAVALDLSQSMSTRDPGFRIRGQQADRLEIAKEVLKRFVLRRPNDRIGLVAFSVRAYIAGPLTLDHDFLIQNIDRLDLNSVEHERADTAIGSGLLSAINRLRDLKSKSKIIILMTDGQNNAGNVPPLTAAEAAKALTIKVYTIGVGAAPGSRVDPFTGRTVGDPRADEIDEETLKSIASKTGGKYYRAESTETLRRIYDEIDHLEKTEIDVKKFVQVKELFQWAALPGCFFLFLELLLGNTLWRRLP